MVKYVFKHIFEPSLRTSSEWEQSASQTCKMKSLWTLTVTAARWFLGVCY